MIFIAVACFGLVSLLRLSPELFPDITFPMASIITTYEGVGPEDLEKLIARPLEERLIARIAHNLDISDDAAAVTALYHRLRWPLRTGSGPELLIAARAG